MVAPPAVRRHQGSQLRDIIKSLGDLKKTVSDGEVPMQNMEMLDASRFGSLKSAIVSAEGGRRPLGQRLVEEF